MALRFRSVGDGVICIFSLEWKGTAYSPSQRGVDLYIEKDSTLLPDWYVLMHMRTPNPDSLIGAKSIVLMGQSGPALIGW